MVNPFKIFIICFLSLINIKLIAGDVVRNARLDGPALYSVTPSLFVKYDKYSLLPFPITSSITVNSSIGLIKFGIDETKKIYHPVRFTSIINFTYTTKDFSLTSTGPLTQTLLVNYDPTQPFKGEAVYNLSSASYTYNVSYIEILSFSIQTYTNYGAPGQTLVSNPMDLYLEETITTNETLTVDLLNPLPPISSIGQNTIAAITNPTLTTYLQAYWDYVPGAETYELEWIFIDDYDASFYGAVKSPSVITYDFNHDATRIITTNQYYNIPLVYEQGWIIFRVRGVGNSQINGNRLEGVWSNGAIASGNLASFNAAFINQNYHINKPHQDDKINWASTRTYAEDGKSGIGVSYEDGLMKNRQSVAKLNTEDKTIAQSTLYDWQGRPTVSILPVPITDNFLSYKVGLNMTPTVGVQFDKNVFDNLTLMTNTCSPQGAIISSSLSSGASKYYSSNNSDKDAQQGVIPDAHGFPYTQVDYYPDQTGRIKRQTLPGNAHFLGSGKEQQFFYSQPTQEELVRLFGTEVGLYNQYEKHTSIDPNGQSSVSYIDDQGRTVATALSGASPSNLLAIADATNPATAQSFTTVIVNNNNDPSNYVLALSSNFFASQGEVEQISYNVNVPVYTSTCLPNMCLDCIYELDLSLTDDCNNELLPGGPITQILGRYNPTVTPSFSVSCPSNPSLLAFSLNPSPFSFTVPVTGNYHLHKTLKLSSLPLSQYAMNFVQTSTCISTLANYQADALVNLDLSGCSDDCAACSTAVTTYTLAHPTVLSQTQIQDMLKQCNSKCNQRNLCSAQKEIMLSYFRPGGYFANYGPNPPNVSTSPLSIFNPSNNLTATLGITGTSNTLTSFYTFSNPPFSPPNTSAYGTYTVPTPSYSFAPVAPKDLSLINYISTYNDNYSQPWLMWHPEYCKAQFYCDPLISAITSYSNIISNINSFDDACQQGYLFPVPTASTASFINHPTSLSCAGCTTASPVYVPLSGWTTIPTSSFTTSDAASALSTLTSSLTSISFTPSFTGNIYQYAIGFAEAINPASITADPFGFDPCYRDQQWRFYKTLYLNFINEIVVNLESAYIGKWNLNPGLGGCLTETQILALPNYHRVFPNLSVTSNTFISNFLATYTTPGAMVGAVTASFTSQCSAYCQSYVNNWISDLGPCAISPTYSLGVQNGLLAVCKMGCDVNDPFGASTTNTAVTITAPSGTVNVSSFQDVLSAFGYTPGISCNAYLITAPKPKGYSYSGVLTHTLDACGCDAIITAHKNYLASSPTCSLTESIYFQSIGMPLIDIGSYVCACNAAKVSTLSPTTYSYNFANVPANLAHSLALPQNLSCQNCIPCSAINAPTLIAQYNTLFGVGTSPASVNPTLLQNFYNNQLNMNNTASEWVNFIKDCANNNAGGGTYNSTNGITSLTTQQCKDMSSFFNLIYSLGFLNASNTYTLNSANGPSFFASTLWTSAIATPTVPQKIQVITLLSPTSITITINPLTLGTSYPCTFYVSNPAANFPAFTSSISAGFFDIKGTCVNALTSTGSPTISPIGFVLSFNYVNALNTLITNTLTGYNTNFITLNTPQVPGSPQCTPYLCSNGLNISTPTVSCVASLINNALNTAQTQYSLYISQQVAQFLATYKNYCYANVTENTKRAYSLNEYNYTLYYYDRAGNLVHTVPPASVQVITNAATIANAITYVNTGTGSPIYPTHSLNNNGINSYVSHYQYNTFDAPLLQVTPDGGQTDYLYDYVGRLVASRNAKQANPSENTWSYTLYDKFGRITDVGVLLLNPSDVLTNTITTNPSLWASFVSTHSKQEVTQSFYDDPTIPALNAQFTSGQQNLRNRVSYTTYEFTFDNNPLTYDYATAYSYDDHGNATDIVQQNPQLNYTGPLNEFKHINYQFDLISGNVNKVSFQAGQRDQFHHKYFYDADNRLHDVYTSTDGILYQHDAKYFYYQHGPMARTELGEKQVQGTDFAFTIQGWIKGINSTVLQNKNDIGKDANATNAYMNSYNGIHQDFAQDAASYNLNYFVPSSTYTNSDYDAINSNTTIPNFLADLTNLNLGTGFNLTNDGPNLFNGNISSMVTSIYDITTGHFDLGLVKPQITANKYDQLHRINQVKAFSSLRVNDISLTQQSEAINLKANQWITPAAASNYVKIYDMKLTYDKLGNINSLKRFGDAVFTTSWTPKAMDDLSYNYNMSAGIFVPGPALTINSTNRLLQITDAAPVNYPNDIHNQTSTTNYAYNGIGSLTQDLSEEIALIQWTDAHKVKSVTRTTGSLKPDIFYNYDGFGRRISKTVKGKTPSGLIDPNNIITTYYTLDVQGNTMAIYEEHKIKFVPNPTLTCSEQSLYGSSRLGVNNTNIDMLAPIVSPSLYLETDYGNKAYELTNHLGNVLTTVSDRKLAIVGTYSYVGNGNDNFVFDGTQFIGLGPNQGYFKQLSLPTPTVDFYVPQIQSVADYYAFGQTMPGRSNSLAAYRYGMNGQEKENEVIGGDGVFSAEFWMYDSRSGRRWENDPITSTWESPYAAFSNNPIALNDVKGLQDDKKKQDEGKKKPIDDGRAKGTFYKKNQKQQKKQKGGEAPHVETRKIESVSTNQPTAEPELRTISNSPTASESSTQNEAGTNSNTKSNILDFNINVIKFGLNRIDNYIKLIQMAVIYGTGHGGEGGKGLNLQTYMGYVISLDFGFLEKYLKNVKANIKPPDFSAGGAQKRAVDIAKKERYGEGMEEKPSSQKPALEKTDAKQTSDSSEMRIVFPDSTEVFTVKKGEDKNAYFNPKLRGPRKVEKNP